MPDLTSPDLIGLAALFRLAKRNPQPTPGQVFVLVPVADCDGLAAALEAQAKSPQH